MKNDETPIEKRIRITRENQILRAFLKYRIKRCGVLHPNSLRLESEIGQILLTPPFKGLGVTIGELRDLYVDASSDICTKPKKEMTDSEINDFMKEVFGEFWDIEDY